MSNLQTRPSPKDEPLDERVVKKKKRSLGTFACPDCDKTFTRTDHLARHHLNHDPKELFECDFILEGLGGGRRKCGKMFVRKDLRDRHMKRHLSTGPNSRVNWSSVSSNSSEKDSPDTRLKTVTTPSVGGYTPIADSPLQISNLVHAVEPNDMNGFSGRSNNLLNIDKASSTTNGSDIQMSPLRSPERKLLDDYKMHGGMQSQNELISWLFNDSSPPHVISPMNEPIKMVSHQGTPKTPGPIVNQEYEAPGYGNVQNYEIFESNVFQNDLNPLDEALIRSYSMLPLYSENAAPPQGQSDQNTVVGSNSIKPHHFNLNIPSTFSLTSPTSTNDSNPSPLSIVDVFSPATTSNIQRKIHEYGSKFNTPINTHIYVDKGILHSLFVSLPSLQRDFVESIFNDKVLTEDRFSYYLSVYWSVFHPQFNVLHRASFNTLEAKPLLLWSMILVGCSYCVPPDKPETVSQVRSKSPEHKLALAIAGPLRFQVFQDDGFKSPVKLWVLQSLNFLEWSEKNFLSRTMHERAHIHHGTAVQLMRRSPALGGNPVPTNKNESDEEDEANTEKTENDKNDAELFKKWVDSESMKRITFMTFYLDIADYVKFRHNPVIEFHQLQLLKLPCDDDLWEASDVNGSFLKVMKKQKKLNNHLNPNETFLNILKKLMKSNQKLDLKVSSFMKKILFGGLLSIMYQIQQLELQNSVSLVPVSASSSGNGSFQAWKEALSTSFDNFSIAVDQSCKHFDCNKEKAKFRGRGISTCKFPLYHIAHVVGLCDLNTYDISTYCGMPANQNVIISLKDIVMVERKLQNMWLKDHQRLMKKDIINFKAIIHCYLYLWETLLDQEDGSLSITSWEPDKDYHDGMFAMSLVMQVLWSYCYVTSGGESKRYSEIEHTVQNLSAEDLPNYSAETAYNYLLRIRQEFLTYLKIENLDQSYAVERLYDLDRLKDTPHDILVKYCHILAKISNKQNISGLCFLVGSKLYNSQWQLVRENGRLIINCGFRSIGKKEVICKDVFDVELTD